MHPSCFSYFYFSRLALVLVFLTGIGPLFGQVGIGNFNPDSTSVLDLSNADNKGLVLPSVGSTTNFAANPSLGMVYFTNDLIYYKRSDGYNALTPWKYKFNGNTSEDVYYNSGGYIGIGATSLTVAPEAPLQVQPDQPVSLADNGTVMIGAGLGPNLVVNSGEVQTRNSGSSAPLRINEDGGDITLGAPANPVELSVSGKVRELHRPTGQYYDVITPGTIMMWYGTTADIPTGWALCDGGSYTLSDNSGTLQSPDLSGRFIVSAGSNGSSTYAAHDTGGQDSVALATNELGAHSHNISLTTSSGGNHTHSMGGSYRSHDGNGSGGDDGLQIGGSDRTGSSGSHSHSVSGSTTMTGNGDAHENRPAYHALVFIIKL